MYTNTQIKTKEEARQYAINWQAWQSKQSLSYYELYKWQEYFERLGRKLGLLREFKREGII
jgi:hypothetical protein